MDHRRFSSASSAYMAPLQEVAEGPSCSSSERSFGLSNSDANCTNSRTESSSEQGEDPGQTLDTAYLTSFKSGKGALLSVPVKLPSQQTSQKPGWMLTRLNANSKSKDTPTRNHHIATEDHKRKSTPTLEQAASKGETAKPVASPDRAAKPRKAEQFPRQVLQSPFSSQRSDDDIKLQGPKRRKLLQVLKSALSFRKSNNALKRESLVQQIAEEVYTPCSLETRMSEVLDTPSRAPKPAASSGRREKPGQTPGQVVARLSDCAQKFFRAKACNDDMASASAAARDLLIQAQADVMVASDFVVKLLNSIHTKAAVDCINIIQLVYMIALVAPPSKQYTALIDSHLAEAVKVHEGSLKQDVQAAVDELQAAIAHCQEFGPRKKVPTLAELQAQLNGGVAKIAVNLMDGTFLHLPYNMGSTVNMSNAKVADMLGLQDYSAYGIFVSQQGEKPLSVLVKQEAYIGDVADGICRSQGEGVTFQLVFKRLFFARALDRKESISATNLAFYQIRADFLDGRYPLDFKEAAQLMALVVHCESTNQSKSGLRTHQLIANHPQLKGMKQDSEWYKEVSIHYAYYSSLTKLETQRHFIGMISKKPCGRSVFFDGKSMGGPLLSLTKDVSLAVNHKGFHILAQNPAGLLKTLPLKDISHYGVQSRVLSITARHGLGSQKYKFATSQGPLMCYILQNQLAHEGARMALKAKSAKSHAPSKNSSALRTTPAPYMQTQPGLKRSNSFSRDSTFTYMSTVSSSVWSTSNLTAPQQPASQQRRDKLHTTGAWSGAAAAPRHAPRRGIQETQEINDYPDIEDEFDEFEQTSSADEKVEPSAAKVSALYESLKEDPIAARLALHASAANIYETEAGGYDMFETAHGIPVESETLQQKRPSEQQFTLQAPGLEPSKLIKIEEVPESPHSVASPSTPAQTAVNPKFVRRFSDGVNTIPVLANGINTIPVAQQDASPLADKLNEANDIVMNKLLDTKSKQVAQMQREGSEMRQALTDTLSRREQQLEEDLDSTAQGSAKKGGNSFPASVYVDLIFELDNAMDRASALETSLAAAWTSASTAKVQNRALALQSVPVKRYSHGTVNDKTVQCQVLSQASKVLEAFKDLAARIKRVEPADEAEMNFPMEPARSLDPKSATKPHNGASSSDSVSKLLLATCPALFEKNAII